MGLSAVVITYNEESRLERCLSSLGFADEIVVVDSFSTDKTMEIARRYTDKFFQREFTGYSDQKNAAIARADEDWIIIVDADEVITPELASEIKAAMKCREYEAYRMPRSTYFLGRKMRYCGWYPDAQLRLVKRAIAHIPERLVHETLHVDCQVGYLKNEITHYSYDSMSVYCAKMASYARMGAAQKFGDGCNCRLIDILLNPVFAFIKMYIVKQGFRDGMHGLVLSVLTACSSALRYAILWDLGRQKSLRKERENENLHI